MPIPEPLRWVERRLGADAATARERAEHLLDRLAIPHRLWSLPPATFSGGEQQRVNIARGLVAEHPILLLDEPTAALDAANCDAVIELIDAARQRGAAIVAIFHDQAVREAVATRTVEIGLDAPHRPADRRRIAKPELIFTNAQIVTADEVIDGTVVVRGGEIVGVDAGPSHAADAQYLAGGYLLPGLIELPWSGIRR